MNSLQNRNKVFSLVTGSVIGRRTMVKIEGFEIPEDLYYDVENHVWVKIVNDAAMIGLDDVGQFLARRIVFVKPRPPGTAVNRGEAVAMLESVKWVGPLPSPLTGTVIEVNDQVVRRPMTINHRPYEAWIVKLRPTKLSEELQFLVTGSVAIEKQREDILRRGLKRVR